MYNFDFISLNYVLPYWDHPEGKVRIGILQPNSAANPDTLMKYEGTVTIKYEDHEERNGQLCRRYSIGGEGLRGYTGFLWLSNEKGYIEDMEIPIADNPDWVDFKFRFISSMHMAPAQWTEFMDTEIKKLKLK